MIKAIRKFLFKRQYLRAIQREIWTNDIEIAHQTKGITDLEAEQVKRETEREALQAEFDELSKSHQRADRDKAKEVAKQLTDKKQVIGKYEMSAVQLRKNIDSKTTSNEYLHGKIKFVKEQF